MNRPQHGGNLAQAAVQYGRPVEEWLDLSTGINPYAWPVPEIPADVWQRLPEANGHLEATAADYYGADHLLAVPGSQAAISLIPHLFEPARVGVLSPGFAEHAYCWQQAGHKVEALSADQIEMHLARYQHLVLINPCNPSGVRFSAEQLLNWHRRLLARGGSLIVDEAFIDPDPAQSLVSCADREGLIVLRSVGKFFGLAGIRLGFVFAEQAFLACLAAQLQPWAVSHPARWVGEQALADRSWQQQMRERLQGASQWLVRLLREAGLEPAGGCALFQWVCRPDAAQIAEQLAEQGVWVRYFDEPVSVRFGLPGRKAEWQRLDQALQSLKL